MMVSSTSTSTRPPVPSPSDLRGLGGQVGQEPGGDRVELAHVTEAERAQERPQRRRRVRPRKDPTHPTVPQQRHVVDAVRAGDHPRHQRGDLQPGVGALVARDAEVLTGQRRKPAESASANTGTRPADDTRFGSSNTAAVAARV